MRHHHGSDTPTSARAILHHTDQKGPNIMHPSVSLESNTSNISWTVKTTLFPSHKGDQISDHTIKLKNGTNLRILNYFNQKIQLCFFISPILGFVFECRVSFKIKSSLNQNLKDNFWIKPILTIGFAYHGKSYYWESWRMKTVAYLGSFYKLCLHLKGG